MTPPSDAKTTNAGADLDAETREHQATAARAIALKEALAAADAAERSLGGTGPPAAVAGLVPPPAPPSPDAPGLVAALHDYAAALTEWGRLRAAWREVAPLAARMAELWEAIAAYVVVEAPDGTAALIPDGTQPGPAEELIQAWRSWVETAPAAIDTLSELHAAAERSAQRHRSESQAKGDIPIPPPPTLLLAAGTPASVRTAARRLRPAIAEWDDQVDRLLRIHEAVSAYRDAAAALHAETPHDPDRVLVRHGTLANPYGTAVSAQATKALVSTLETLTTSMDAVLAASRESLPLLAQAPADAVDTDLDAPFFALLSAFPRLAPDARRIAGDLAAWRDAHGAWRQQLERADEIRAARQRAEACLIRFYRTTPHDPEGILATGLREAAAYQAMTDTEATRAAVARIDWLVELVEEALRLSTERAVGEKQVRARLAGAPSAAAARLLADVPVISPRDLAGLPAAITAWQEAVAARDEAIERAVRCGETLTRLEAAFEEQAAVQAAWPHRMAARGAVPAELRELARSLAEQNDADGLAALEAAWTKAVDAERRAFDEAAACIQEIEAATASARALIADDPAAYRWESAIQEFEQATGLTPAEVQRHNDEARGLLRRLEAAKQALERVAENGKPLDATVRALGTDHPHASWQRDARDAFYDMDTTRIETIAAGLAARTEDVLAAESRRLGAHRERAVERRRELEDLEEGGVPAALANMAVDLAESALDALGDGATRDPLDEAAARERLASYLAACQALESGLAEIAAIYAAELDHLEAAAARLDDRAATARAEVDGETQGARAALERLDFAAVQRHRARVHSLLTHAVYRDEMDIRTLRRLASDILIANERVVEPEVTP